MKEMTVSEIREVQLEMLVILIKLRVIIKLNIL